VIEKAKTASEQAKEIEKLVSDALDKLDQAGYGLRLLQDRLKDQEQSSKDGG
jgi:hypothetical protein